MRRAGSALTGCATYVEHRPARTVYIPPPTPQPLPPTVYVSPPAEAPVVVIQTENDFYEPLSTHGRWVVVESYGRCWVPSRVEVGWRPYANGHWQRTDAGWYWASDEPWGWATYHYGRWDFSGQFGWYWVPHTQWAPAWVSWRQGAGYVGWAPLPPSARIEVSGVVDIREPAFAPRAFVFVEQRRLLEPVRPRTVIVNNTTTINKTVNITKVQVVNKTVINEGPQVEVIERQSGQRIHSVPVRELRRKEETEFVTQRRNIPSPSERRVEPPVRVEAAPTTVVPVREPRQLERPADTTRELQPRITRNEVRKSVDQKPETTSAQRGDVNPVRDDRQRQVERNESNFRGKADVKYEQAVPPREARQFEKPAQATNATPPPAPSRQGREINKPQPASAFGRSEVKKPALNEQPRALQGERISSGTKSETVRPSIVGRPPPPQAGKQAERQMKSPQPGKEKQPAGKQREASKKEKVDKKKGETEEAPSRQPVSPPKPPQ